MEEKKCTKCGSLKPFKEFFKQFNGKYGLSSQCKKCRIKYVAEWRDKNRDHINELVRYREREKRGFERLRTDPNEIVIKGGITEIVLYNDNCKEIARTKIDTEALEKVKNYKWCLSGWGYAWSGKKKGVERNIFLHHLILPRVKGMVTDHINRNKLDNRKENLRNIGHSLSARNKNIRSDNISGVIGVNWDNKQMKWRAVLMIKGKTVFSKRAQSFHEAVRLRKEAEKKYNYFNSQGET